MIMLHVSFVFIDYEFVIYEKPGEYGLKFRGAAGISRRKTIDTRKTWRKRM